MRTGTAAGWNVYRATTFSGALGTALWHWSAYGYRGGTHGTAKTEEEAVRLAKREAAWLNEPRSSHD